MKKITALILALLLTFSLFTGCGAGGAMTDAAVSGGSSMNGSSASYDSAPKAESAPSGGDYDYSSSTSGNDGGSSLKLYTNTNSNLAEKIIYSAAAQIETTEFDATIENVYMLLDRYGAFLEKSYVSGINYSDSYYGRARYRNANFTVRVPSDKFVGMTDGLSELGNVVYLSSDTQNITPQFYDLEARLKTYKTEEARLLEMLEKAETVADMILIEERLSNVRYDIESAQTTLNSWQTEVDYSTIELSITEVKELTEKPEELTYWQEITKGLGETFESIGEFFKDLFKNIVVALPVIIIFAAAIAIVIAVVVRIRRKAKKRKYNDTIDE